MTDPSNIKEYAEILISVLRPKARELGYALCVHGSLSRDIDLLACPWIDNAVPAGELAEALRQTAEHVCGSATMVDDVGADNPDYFYKGTPGAKPHGRLCWSFYLSDEVYIDLSVMPLNPAAFRTPVLAFYPDLISVHHGRDKKIPE